MAGTRQYRRKSNGQFAGASGGTKVTTGRSGGFANSAFRSRVAQSRVASKTGLATRAKGRVANTQVGGFTKRTVAKTSQMGKTVSKKTGMFLKKAARSKAVRQIVAKQLVVAAVNTAIYTAYSRKAGSLNAAKYAKSAPTKGLSAGVKKAMPKMVKPKRGAYKISTL